MVVRISYVCQGTAVNISMLIRSVLSFYFDFGELTVNCCSCDDIVCLFFCDLWHWTARQCVLHLISAGYCSNVAVLLTAKMKGSEKLMQVAVLVGLKSAGIIVLELLGSI